MKCHSFALLFISEIFAGAVGFVVMLMLARRLGPASFADFEYGAAVAAWWLVLVRGGFDTIVYREAARRPRLVRPLTEALLGLRMASAIVGLAFIFTWSSFLELDRSRVVLISGLVLIPSSMATDVGLRASCRFGWLAVVQVTRSLGLLVGVAVFVGGATDGLAAAGCVVTAEIFSTTLLIFIHWAEHNCIEVRFRPRLWTRLARRGLVAGATRFARVSLYAADLLIVANLASATNLGPFSAARRVAFALLALGLVVPSAMAPRFARAWAGGPQEARTSITLTFERLLLILLPATIGLMFTADRLMLLLFGEAFRDGGPWLALIAARLPFVLASNLQQSALTACRREDWALGLVAGMVGLAAVLIPPLAIWNGTWGVAWAVLLIEACGAVAGWIALRKLGVAPHWIHSSGSVRIGCLALIIICSIGRDWSLGTVIIAGAGVYGLVVLLVGDRDWLSSFRVRESLSPVVSGGSST